jgi:hypothetical protein
MQCVPPAYRAPAVCATLVQPYPGIDPCGFPLSVDASGCPILTNPTASTPRPGTAGAPAVYANPDGSAFVYVKGSDNNMSGTGVFRELLYDPATRTLSRGSAGTTSYASSGSIALSVAGRGGGGLAWFTDNSGGTLKIVATDISHLETPGKPFVFAPTGAVSRGFAEPSVIDGRVYIGYSGAVAVLGL